MASGGRWVQAVVVAAGVGLGALFPPASAQEGAGAAPAFAPDLAQALAAGRLAEAAAVAGAALALSPGDPAATFALGAVEFLAAVEGLGHDLWRLGLATDPSPYSLLSGLPILRVPVPPNPAPEPFTVEALRSLLADFAQRLARSEATLAAVPDAPFRIDLDILRIRLDIDGDGQSQPGEGLVDIFAAVSGVAPRGAHAVVGWDAADAAWLQGYAHLLTALTDVLLAHDWSLAVEQSFHGLFPKSRLSGAALGEEARRMEGELASTVRKAGSCEALAPDNAWQLSEGDPRLAAYRRCSRIENALMAGGIADALAFAHLFRWPVVEPARMASARTHLLAMIALSRTSWQRIAAETDDAAEWIPNPAQHAALLPGVAAPVSADTVAGWHRFLDVAEDVLEGRALIPHWRFREDRGINIRRLFEEPRTLDPWLLAQGSAALPYLEAGPMAAGASLETAMRLIDGGGIGLFLWFN